jgi:hypothetical protein
MDRFSGYNAEIGSLPTFSQLVAEASVHRLAFPLVSNGRRTTASPAAIKRAPLVYTGADVLRFANMATMG